MKKLFTIFALCFLFAKGLLASDGTENGYKIWEDLNITAEQYYNSSADLGVLMGFLFASTIIYLVARR